MFQLINGTIECGECRNEILHGEEFDCDPSRPVLIRGGTRLEFLQP